MEQLDVFINEAFRDLLNERGLDVNYLPQVFACLAGHVKYGVFLWRDISATREIAWENIRSRLTAECITQQVPEAHRGTLMSFVQFAFEQVSERCNEADGRAFAEGSRMPMDIVFGSEENSDDSEVDIEDELNQPGPIRIMPGTDLRSVLTRLIYQRTLQRFLQEASQFQDRDDGVEQSVIDAFPRFQYSTSAQHNSEGVVPTTETTCVVCQDDFAEGANCLRIPTCQHFFHEDCIIPWLARRQTCPTCREPCVEGTTSVDEDEDDNDDEDSYSSSEYDY